MANFILKNPTDLVIVKRWYLNVQSWVKYVFLEMWFAQELNYFPLTLLYKILYDLTRQHYSFRFETSATDFMVCPEMCIFT